LQRPDICGDRRDVGESAVRRLEEELLTVGGRHTACMFCAGTPQVVSQLKNVESILNFCKIRVIPADTEGAALECLQKMGVTLVQEGVLAVVVAPEISE